MKTTYLDIAKRVATTRRTPKRGITVADVLKTFAGARIVATNKPDACPDCEGNNIVLARWPGGKYTWICHACGRAVRTETCQSPIKKQSR